MGVVQAPTLDVIDAMGLATHEEGMGNDEEEALARRLLYLSLLSHKYFHRLFIGSNCQELAGRLNESQRHVS